jgi:acyl dehydratase
MRFLEEMTVGERYEVGSVTFTAESIKAFAARFDPQPFHLDEAAAAASHFGALCASGWHTAVVWMPLMVRYRNREDEARRARGEPCAQVGPSPGFRDLKWLNPVYAGDTVSYVTELVDARPSASRPGWGLFTIRTTGTNQHGVPVISFVSTGFVERRPV